ncbi:hypothetical protein [Candidatus Nitrospira salsa]
MNIGIREIGESRVHAVEQVALAFSAVVTNLKCITEHEEAHFACDTPDDKLLLVD